MRELFCVETCGSNLADRIAQPPCFVCPGPAEDDPTTPPLTVPAAFSFVAGASQQSGDVGFSKGVYGTLNSQPLQDFELLEIARRSNLNFQIAFAGDCTEIMDGYMPVIPGVTFNETSPTWTFGGGNTTGNFTTNDGLVSGQAYNVTWVKV